MTELVIGGSGSGKSAFAEAELAKWPGRKIYLATMLPGGKEAEERIARHRQQRAGRGFETVEQGLGLDKLQIPKGAAVLLEDLGNLLANELFSPEGGGREAAERGLRNLEGQCGKLIVVTVDVFAGGYSYEAETLRYLEELARLNRSLAGRAESVTELQCGLPNRLKG